MESKITIRRKIRCAIRPMKPGDISQVAIIDKEAFPTQWPSYNFKRELANKYAHYFVAYYKDDEVLKQSEFTISGQTSVLRSVFSKPGQLLKRIHFFSSDGASVLPNEYILGMAGVWYVIGEAHLITIAVREKYRGHGIGELLVISAIELAIKLSTRALTLEVRISNKTAQNLYKKYGFEETGIRKGYYMDNKEDAMIMHIKDIQLNQFQEKFQHLRQIHLRKMEAFQPGIDHY